MFLALAPQIRRSRSMPNTPARPPQPLWTTSPAIGDGLLQIPPKLFMRGNGVASLASGDLELLAAQADGEASVTSLGA